MKEEFRKYITQLYQYIPSEVYEGLLSIFCIGSVVFFAIWGFKKGLRCSAGLLLVEYLFLIFCSTVFYRTTDVERKYDWHPFWSYDKPELMVENVMNVVVFVPIGMLLVFMIHGLRSQNGSWFKVHSSWLLVLAVGIGISISIEAMQYFFHRGFAETDDVMHNTVGCIVGYMLVKGSRFMVHGLTKIMRYGMG